MIKGSAPQGKNMLHRSMVRLGIDIGSTTVKMAAIGEDGNILYSDYRRHNARAKATMVEMLTAFQRESGDAAALSAEEIKVSVRITGSVGMGIAEQHGLPFVQEVVAATKAIQAKYPEACSMIDIGGEDAKVVLFRKGEASDLRMNGNCAGGTGAFIDQMAIILGSDVDNLSTLALNAKATHPIASRCGVFSKTDVQNLIAKNVPKEDIAASIFHAVAVQTIVTLAHGCDIKTPLLFCGGPLTFIPALRKAFTEYMEIGDEDIILPKYGTLLPAIGSALYAVEDEKVISLSQLIGMLGEIKYCQTGSQSKYVESHRLRPIFSSKEEYSEWTNRLKTNVSGNGFGKAELRAGDQDVYIGIDSGSTTTKIVVTDTDSNILYTFYHANVGNPIETVEKGLSALMARCNEIGANLNVAGCCSTGYGEDLIKAAFQLNFGIVETMAHYIAARRLRRDVSFILDIGGQDMKAIFVTKGVIDRIEINEACSSGCGSFIETFAKTLGYSVADFSKEALDSLAPCDLGTRCTVFMNSKVKQVLREGATISDISAGLAYSVVKNCLYKVLKLKDLSALGNCIVVQGGTMRNDAIVRALEILTGAEVCRPEAPELMGALGCALYSREGVSASPTQGMSLSAMLSKAMYSSRHLHCKGCDNSCLVVKYTFENGKNYYSGNRCEKVFSNGELHSRKGENAYAIKNELLFGEPAPKGSNNIKIGIPRVLNMFEDYPFWKTLFSECGFEVILSDPSRFQAYEQCARMVMSDNICFPAKLVHSHIKNLCDKGADRIFMPFVVYESASQDQDSYNCPVVAGYGEVVKGVQQDEIPIDTPSFGFKNPRLLLKQCHDYLSQFQISGSTLKKAFQKALEAQSQFRLSIAKENDRILSKSRCEGALTILLAGRPYHADPLVQHKVADMLRDMGINVITDDIVRDKETDMPEAHFLAQWSYPNRILKAANWCAHEGDDVQFVQMTSFGCGPDAFLVDEVKDVLMRQGKVLTLLKLDDINNIGSMKLRVRSLVESLKIAGNSGRKESAFKTTPTFAEEFKDRKILVPYFTPFVSPFIPAVMKLAGYNVENLPVSDSSSCDNGLKYANNEVCYPATLVVGDVVKAIKSGKYDKDDIAVAMTQTGGQCRASNYVALIKRAFVNAGIADVPVIAVTIGGGIKNDQPGFHPNWLKVLPTAFNAIMFGDCIAKFFYSSVVREREPGLAENLKNIYIEEGVRLVEQNKANQLTKLLAKAASDFDSIVVEKDCPKVGVVGEIFLKFNPFAQKDVTGWLIKQGVEVVPPMLADFFLQAFVNRKVNEKRHINKKSSWAFAYGLFYNLIKKQYRKVNKIATSFRYFTPFNDIFSEADEAKKVINLSAQFGEGWLLPAEIMTYASKGVNSVVSLQPFGCIANHIVARGIEKRIKEFYPDLNMLSLDFDSGVSDVNVTNRLLLFIENVKKSNRKEVINERQAVNA